MLVEMWSRSNSLKLYNNFNILHGRLSVIPLLGIYSGEASPFGPGVVYKNVHCSIFHASYELGITRKLIGEKLVVYS